jgi:hypothetical protein
MLYVDYTWDLREDRIKLDCDLNTDKLGWRHGDLFEFVNVDGQQQLVKVDPLIKFLHDGTRQEQIK